MTTAAPEGVAIEAREGALHITLDRPAHKNALDHAAIRHIVAALESAATDDSLRAAERTSARALTGGRPTPGGRGRAPAASRDGRSCRRTA